jgi:cytoskeletal protein RodZ
VALENGDFGFFTSTLYARSFLKQYGDYVGLNVEPWIDHMVPTTLIDGEAVESILEIDAPISAPPVREKMRDHGSGGGAMPAMWLIIITGGLIWAGQEFYRLFERKLANAPKSVSAPVTTIGRAEPPAQEAYKPEKENTASNEVPEPPRRAIIVREE